jgi:hypothetical protein
MIPPVLMCAGTLTTVCSILDRYRDDPSLIPDVVIEPDFLTEAATAPVCEAYDAVLDAFRRTGGANTDTIEAALAAAKVNPKVAAYMAGHQTLPPFEKWAKENVSDKADAKPPTESQKNRRAAVAYCARSLNAWRMVPGALDFMEEQTVAAFPMAPRVCKCDHPPCFVAGEHAEFKRCSACKHVFYCTAKCQKQDWARHKVDCLRWRKDSTV